MRKAFILSFIVYLFLTACSERDQYYKTDVIKETFRAKPCDTIVGQEVNLYGILMPNGIQCVDSLLILISKDEPLIRVYNTYTDSIISQFGYIGHSKEEFIHPPLYCYFGVAGNGKTFMYLPDDQNPTKEVDLEASMGNKSVVVNRVIKHDYYDESAFFCVDSAAILMYRDLSPVDDIRDEMWNPPYWEIQSPNKNEVVSVFPEIIVGNGDIIPFVYKMSVGLKPDHTKFVTVNTSQDLFTITDVKNCKTIGVKGNDFYNLEYIQNVFQSMGLLDAINKLKVYNIGCCVSDDYIFCLHDGKREASKIDIMEGLEPIVNVYDWTGDFVTSFMLKEPICVIAYNACTHKLYGLSYNYELFEYNISNIVK